MKSEGSCVFDGFWLIRTAVQCMLFLDIHDWTKNIFIMLGVYIQMMYVHNCKNYINDKS